MYPLSLIIGHVLRRRLIPIWSGQFDSQTILNIAFETCEQNKKQLLSFKIKPASNSYN